MNERPVRDGNIELTWGQVFMLYAAVALLCIGITVAFDGLVGLLILFACVIAGKKLVKIRVVDEDDTPTDRAA